MFSSTLLSELHPNSIFQNIYYISIHHIYLSRAEISELRLPFFSNQYCVIPNKIKLVDWWFWNCQNLNSMHKNSHTKFRLWKISKYLISYTIGAVEVFCYTAAILPVKNSLLKFRIYSCDISFSKWFNVKPNGCAHMLWICQ